jgi:CRP/FNR family transcriptional regulator, cyclic AMP receptor protein
LRGENLGVPMAELTSETERLARLLEEVTPFSILHPDDLRDVVRRVRSRAYPRGEVIFREGEPGRTLYVIERGQVKLSTSAPGGRELLVAVLGRGQIFGELEMFDGGPRGMTARTMEDVDAFVLDKHLVQAILRTRPAFVRRLLELIARRLRRADQAAQDLVFFDASTRLARRLLQLADEHGAPDPSGPRIRIQVRLTQDEVGQMIGVNRSSVNRVLRAFASQGLVDWNGGMPVIEDPSRLSEMARS